MFFLFLGAFAELVGKPKFLRVWGSIGTMAVGVIGGDRSGSATCRLHLMNSYYTGGGAVAES